MKLKNFPLLIPTLLLPYCVVATLLISFDNSKVIEKVMGNNIFNLIGALLIYVAFSIVTLIIYVILSIVNKTDPLTLARTAMVLKLCQIPAYVAIFVFGCLFFITIFTVPFSLALFLFDYVTLLLTGGAFVVALFKGRRMAKLHPALTVIFFIAQFFFCVDVAASIWLYAQLKKHTRQ